VGASREETSLAEVALLASYREEHIKKSIFYTF